MTNNFAGVDVVPLQGVGLVCYSERVTTHLKAGNVVLLIHEIDFLHLGSMLVQFFLFYG